MFDATPSFRQVWSAIDSGDAALVRRVLMKFPAEINNDDPATGCHLHHACGLGKLEVVQAMVESGARIDLKNARDGSAPIVRACSNGRIEVASYLLSQECVLDVSSSLTNPLFACIASSLYRNAAFAKFAGYKEVGEVRQRLIEVASMLIENGIDLTVSYNQQSMVDIDASAFAYMFGMEDIAEAIIRTIYGHDKRLAASAWAEAIEVALGNACSRAAFRRRRYPPTRGKNAGARPPMGEYWGHAGP